MFTLSDDVAHLVTAEHLQGSQCSHPHVHFSLGTGVGFAVTNSKGKVRAEKDLFCDGVPPWDLSVNLAGRQGKAWELGETAYKQLPPTEFVGAWEDFYRRSWLPFYEKRGWSRPRQVSFSGGLPAKDRRLADDLSSIDISALVFVVPAPDAAGLLGAAVATKQGRSFE